jgi:site-specific DNA-cytosine methylase
MLMLDLFSGLGGASRVMREHGWEVISVDINPEFKPDICTDMTKFCYHGPTPDLVWASPPCTEFSKDSMPRSWSCNKIPPHPDITLLLAAKRVIDVVKPRWWVIENVRGSVKYFEPVLGHVRKKVGSRYLWGEFPVFDCDPVYGKWRLPPSKDRAAIRSMIPKQLSEAICIAIERSNGKIEDDKNERSNVLETK